MATETAPNAPNAPSVTSNAPNTRLLARPLLFPLPTTVQGGGLVRPKFFFPRLGVAPGRLLESPGILIQYFKVGTE